MGKCNFVLIYSIRYSFRKKRKYEVEDRKYENDSFEYFRVSRRVVSEPVEQFYLFSYRLAIANYMPTLTLRIRIKGFPQNIKKNIMIKC